MTSFVRDRMKDTLDVVGMRDTVSDVLCGDFNPGECHFNLRAWGSNLVQVLLKLLTFDPWPLATSASAGMITYSF